MMADLSTGPTSIIGLLTGQIVMLLSAPRPTGTAAGLLSPPASGNASSAGAAAAVTGAASSSSFVFRRQQIEAMAANMSAPAGGAFPQMGMGMGAPALARLPPLPPTLVAATMAVSIGILSLIMGAFKLGWLLDFVSLPVLVGFFLSAGLIIIQGQVPTILGEVGVSNDFITQGPDIIHKINTAQPITIAIGVSSLALLIILQLIGKKWGKNNAAIWAISTSKNAIVLLLFTGISYGVNKDRAVPLFAVTGEVPKGLAKPQLPNPGLLLALIFLSIPIFIAASLEHVMIAKSFARKDNYHIDQSQELTYLGVTNIINGILGGMPVGGSIITSAINSEAGVRSPLGGIFTSGIVLLGIYAITGALFWIPKASLAAIIIVAVINVLPPQSIALKYWKISFMDFVGNFLAMNFTLVAGAEMGIGLGVAFMLIYTLIRTVFAHAEPVTRSDLERKYGNEPSLGTNEPNYIPPGTQVLEFNEAIFYLNAERLRRDIMNTIQTYQTGLPEDERPKERLWNDLGQKRIDDMRRNSTLNLPTRYIPRIRVLVLDFTHVSFIDTTGMQMLEDMKAELIAYAGEDVEIRIVGMNAALKSRFKRAKWELATAEESMKGLADGKDAVWELLKPAIEAPRTVRDSGLDFGFGNVMMSESRSIYGDEKKTSVIVTSVSVKGGKAFKE